MHTNSGAGGANRPVGDSSRRCHHCCFEDSSRQRLSSVNANSGRGLRCSIRGDLVGCQDKGRWSARVRSRREATITSPTRAGRVLWHRD